MSNVCYKPHHIISFVCAVIGCSKKGHSRGFRIPSPAVVLRWCIKMLSEPLGITNIVILYTFVYQNELPFKKRHFAVSHKRSQICHNSQCRILHFSYHCFYSTQMYGPCHLFRSIPMNAKHLHTFTRRYDGY